MTIEELRTKAAEAFAGANEILQKYPTADMKWSEEDKKAFTERNQLAANLNSEYLEMEKHQKTVEEVQRGVDFYSKTRADRSKETVTDETLEAQAREQHHRAFQAVLRGRSGNVEAGRILAESEIPDSVWKRLAMGEDGSPLGKRALMSTIDSAGGFTAPDDFVAQLQKDLADTTSVAGDCRQIPTSRNLVSLPALKSHATKPKQYSSKFIGTWVNEEDRDVTAQAKQGGEDYFEIVNIPVGIYEPPLIPITFTMLEDTAINIEDELRALLVDISDTDLAYAILRGDGLMKSPKGIVPTISADSGLVVNSGSASAITYELFSNLNAALAPQYHVGAKWEFSQDTLAKIHQLKGSTNDHPLVQAFTNQDMIYGKPYRLSNHMDNPGTNTFPVLLANYKYYGLARMKALGIRVYDQMKPGMNYVYARMRVGGGVIRKQAFRVGKCAAA